MKVARREALRLLAAAAANNAFARGDVELRFTSVSPRTVRISVANPAAEIPNPGFLLPEVGSRKPEHVSAPGPRRLKLGEITVSVQENPLTIQLGRRVARSAPRLSLDLQSGAFSFSTSDGPVFGLGEGGPNFDRRGVLHTMENGQIGREQRTYGARVPVPLLLGARGWSLFVHQPEGRFDLTDTRTGKFLAPEPPAVQPLDLFVTIDDDPAVLLREYAVLTGLPDMPPLWAFGYQQSHRTLASREEILGIARTFREKWLPCDVLIYLGTGFSPSGWNTGHESFTFNRSVFPDPTALIEDLHQQHFRVMLHVVHRQPVLRGSAADVCTTPGNSREAGCYWQMHREVFRTGIDGWWPDEGDKLDARSRLARNRFYHEGPLLDRPNVRPYALHRNGAPGSQRFGAFLWSGDVASTWETLQLHVPVAVNTGLSGLPFWGMDTGGFVPTKELTGELYVRWFQFSAFCPLFRSHGRTWKLRLPWQ